MISPFTNAEIVVYAQDKMCPLPVVSFEGRYIESIDILINDIQAWIADYEGAHLNRAGGFDEFLDDLDEYLGSFVKPIDYRRQEQE